MKRTLAFLLALCMVFTMLPMTAYAEETVVAEGTCGENLTWTYTDDGVLTISGVGAMYDYPHYFGEYDGPFSCAPWYDYQYSVQNAVIEYGVTYIGSGAFFACSNINNVIMPDSITAIGEFAFCSSSLETVNIPANVTSIGSYALAYANISAVTFLGDVPSMEDNTFLGITATVYYLANNPTWTEEVMQNYGGTVTWNAK